jgi:hypothetical protein
MSHDLNYFGTLARYMGRIMGHVGINLGKKNFYVGQNSGILQP